MRKKNDLAILPANLLCPSGIVAHPFYGALRRHFFPRDQVAFDQYPSGWHKRITVVRIVVDAKHFTVLETNARRTLDLDGERVGGIAQPADFQVLAVERTVLDLATVVIRHEFAGRGAPEGAAVVGKRASVRYARRHQIARATEQRHGEFPGREARSVDDRLIVPGEKTGGIAEPADMRGDEIGFEELPRRLGREAARPDRTGAHVLERGAHGPGVDGDAKGFRTNVSSSVEGLRTKRVGADDRTAACVKGCERAGMVVAVPAIEIVPTGGLQRCVGDLQRPRVRIIRGGSRSSRRSKNDASIG
jgi:hypothetical protein